MSKIAEDSLYTLISRTLYNIMGSSAGLDISSRGRTRPAAPPVTRIFIHILTTERRRGQPNVVDCDPPVDDKFAPHCPWLSISATAKSSSSTVYT
jgi:hypothetical protein